MIDAYVRDLSTELRRAGIPRRVRRRILAETADHLHSDPGGEARFGDARDIARRFADELGSTAARSTSLRAFAVLAVAGAFYGAVFLGWSASGALRTIAQSTRLTPIDLLTVAALVIAPQVAFVAGLLTLIRALRLRGARTIPGAEVRVLNRRSMVALGSGIVAVGATIPFALQHGGALPAWSPVVVVTAAGVTMALLLACMVGALSAARVRVRSAGAAGGLFDDLGPAVPTALRGHPWTFALGVATALALIVFAAGVAGNDAYDGALRAVAEAAACLAGFALLGRFLRLRG